MELQRNNWEVLFSCWTTTTIIIIVIMHDNPNSGEIFGEVLREAVIYVLADFAR